VYGTGEALQATMKFKTKVHILLYILRFISLYFDTSSGRKDINMGALLSESPMYFSRDRLLSGINWLSICN
jgi:hypothetical protein